MSSFPDDADIVALVLAKLPLSELLRACAVCRLWADTGERAVEERQPSSMYQPQLTCGSNFRVGEVVDAFGERRLLVVLSDVLVHMGLWPRRTGLLHTLDVKAGAPAWLPCLP